MLDLVKYGLNQGILESVKNIANDMLSANGPSEALSCLILPPVQSHADFVRLVSGPALDLRF